MMYALQTSEGRFSSLAHQMGKWVDQILGPGYHNFCPTEAWSPAINFYEGQTHYCLVADLAGLGTEEILREDFLRVEKGQIIISGVREAPGLDGPKGPMRVHHMEIDHGRFCRTLALPEDVDLDRIEASYRGGLLWVRMPKRAR